MNIVIIGANSEISKQCSYLWATSNCTFYLIARDNSKLDALSHDLMKRGAKAVHGCILDFNETAKIEPTIDDSFNKLKSVDIVLVCFGNLPNQIMCQNNTSDLNSYIHSDLNSTLTFMSVISNHLETANYGQLIIVSSIAGQLGRASNYVYGSAKAAITCFSSGIRRRLYNSNVIITTILPGLVESPMTHGFKKNIFWTKPEKIAKIIIGTANKKSNCNIYAPSYWRYIVYFLIILPLRFTTKLQFIK